MKKFAILSIAAAAALSLAACSSGQTAASTTAAQTEAAAEETEAPAETAAEETEAPAEETEAETEAPAAEPVTISVAASPTPHAEILYAIQDILSEQGITLEVTEYGDYVVPNTVVEDEEINANYFQHVPYLDQFNLENGTHLVSVAGVHIEPMGVYGGKTASFDELAEGATVAVPNDVTNEARALLLLQSQGLITLSEDAGLDATPNDIVDNPLGLEFEEIEAAMVPTIKDEVDIAVINSNYALQVGLNPVTDSIAIEAADSPYVNILVVKEGHENDPGIAELIEALHSDTCREFIETTYEGAVVPAF